MPVESRNFVRMEITLRGSNVFLASSGLHANPVKGKVRTTSIFPVAFPAATGVALLYTEAIETKSSLPRRSKVSSLGAVKIMFRLLSKTRGWQEV